MSMTIQPVNIDFGLPSKIRHFTSLSGADPGGWIGWLAEPPLWGHFKLEIKKGYKTTLR